VGLRRLGQEDPMDAVGPCTVDGGKILGKELFYGRG
jgi:hypothetical protein